MSDLELAKEFGQGMQPSLPTDSINSGMNTQSQVPAPIAKPVDAKNYEGTNAGTDTRSQAAQPTMPPQPAPRGETGTKGA
jgi:hypothetical protein